MTRPNPSRIRLRYAKAGKIRFTSHRDMARVWERSIRIVGLPVAYSQGYNPRPRLSFGLALPTGFESVGEFLDIDIMPEISLAPNASEAQQLLSGGADPALVLDLEEARTRLDVASPDGISVDGLAQIDRKEQSLQQAVTSCTWNFRIDTDGDTLRRIVDTALTADSLLISRERKGKTMTDDIRPQILDLAVVDAMSTDLINGDGLVLVAELGTQPRALRPNEFLRAIEMPSALTARVQRTHQWITTDLGDAPREPLAAASPTADTTRCSV